MKVTICIGSSCHLKGSREIIETFERLRKENKLEKQVELCGAFCMGNCKKGVSVKIDDGEIDSVSSETAESFFHEKIMGGVQNSESN